MSLPSPLSPQFHTEDFPYVELSLENEGYFRSNRSVRSVVRALAKWQSTHEGGEDDLLQRLRGRCDSEDTFSVYDLSHVLSDELNGRLQMSSVDLQILQRVLDHNSSGRLSLTKLNELVSAIQPSLSPTPDEMSGVETSESSRIRRASRPARQLLYGAVSSSDGNDSLKARERELVKAEAHERILRTMTLVLINMFAVFYGMFETSSRIILIPAEVQHLFPGQENLLVGLIEGLAGIFAFVGPIVGLYSDRSYSRFGRRRPFIVAGSVISIIGIGGMAAASVLFGNVEIVNDDPVLHGSQQLIRWAFVASYWIASSGSVVSFTAFSCLIPDLVPRERLGLATGYMGLLTVVGQAIGYTSFLAVQNDVSNMYIIYAMYGGFNVATVMLTVWNVKEVPRKKLGSGKPRKQKRKTERTPLLHHEATSSEPYVVECTIAPDGEPEAVVIEADDDDVNSDTDSDGMMNPVPLSCGLVFSAFCVNPRKYRNFFFVWCSRILYYMGLSALVFLEYYFKDILLREETYITDTAMVAASSLVAGILLSVPAGRISDRVGRKPLILVSTVMICGAYILFLFVRKWTMWVLAVGVLYGMGNGIYLSVEWALGCQTLPQGEQYGHFLGLWGIAGTLGQVIGPFVMSPLLDIFGKDPVQFSEESAASLALGRSRNTIEGYYAVNAVGCFFVAAACALIYFVKKVR